MIKVRELLSLLLLNIADVSIRFKRKEIKGDKSSNYFSMPQVRGSYNLKFSKYSLQVMWQSTVKKNFNE